MSSDEPPFQGYLLRMLELTTFVLASYTLPMHTQVLSNFEVTINYNSAWVWYNIKVGVIDNKYSYNKVVNWPFESQFDGIITIQLMYTYFIIIGKIIIAQAAVLFLPTCSSPLLA